MGIFLPPDSCNVGATRVWLVAVMGDGSNVPGGPCPAGAGRVAVTARGTPARRVVGVAAARAAGCLGGRLRVRRGASVYLLRCRERLAAVPAAEEDMHL